MSNVKQQKNPITLEQGSQLFPTEPKFTNHLNDFLESLAYLMHVHLREEEEDDLVCRFLGYLEYDDNSSDNPCGTVRKGSPEQDIMKSICDEELVRYLMSGIADLVQHCRTTALEEGYNSGYQSGYQVCKTEYLLQDPAERERRARILKELPVNTYELDISQRAYTALKKIGIERTEDLLNLTKNRLFSLKGIGPKLGEEIYATIEDLGFTLREEPPIFTHP